MLLFYDHYSIKNPRCQKTIYCILDCCGFFFQHLVGVLCPSTSNTWGYNVFAPDILINNNIGSYYLVF